MWQVIKNTAQKLIHVGKTVIDQTKTLAGKITQQIQNKFEKIKKDLFFPSSDMPAESANTIKLYQNNTIINIEVRREPVMSMVQKFLNFISLGQYSQRKRDLNYDDVFHLYMILTLNNGVKLSLEKNERIKITAQIKKSDNFESRIVTVPDRLTLDHLLLKTQQLMGTHYFYQYNAFENNCQDFLLAILKANNMLNNELNLFIKQDAESLGRALPSKFPALSQFITDTAGKVTEVIDNLKRKRDD